jgi:nucleotide-binding universal stress UspA family protein
MQKFRELAAQAALSFEVVATRGIHPYEEIVRAATAYGCDLIWMASHGRKGLDRLLLGSETQRVLSHANIPVLVYR